MKLLIITQKINVNDPILGFFHRWVEEFAKSFEYITVICLERGEYALPGNVNVLSLGKESGQSKVKYLYNFYKYIWQERNKYDAIFVHMNPEYILLGGLLWKVLRKKVSLWYMHKAITPALKAAEKIADVIFTASKESIRVSSKKIVITGHGIDLDRFKKGPQKTDRDSVFKIITVGRITPSKDLKTLIRAIDILVNERQLKNLNVKIVGRAQTEGEIRYNSEMVSIVKEKHLESLFDFVGPVPNHKLAAWLQNSDLFVNMSLTGSLDKAILEAMACGLPVISCNESYKVFIKSIPDFSECLSFDEGDFLQLAQKIKYYISSAEDIKRLLGEKSRALIAGEHDLSKVSKKIFYELTKH